MANGVLTIVVVVHFGRRVDNKWEFDADFVNDNGNEFGELNIELSRIEK